MTALEIAADLTSRAKMTPTNSALEALATDLLAICHEEWRFVSDDNLVSAGRILESRIGGLKNLDGYINCLLA